MGRTTRRTLLAGLVGIGAALIPLRFSCAAEEVPRLLDHILLGCSDLQHGVSFVEQHLGVRAAFGGVHPGRGTQNALFSLGTRHYLEIIAPDPRQAGATLPQWLELQRRRLLGLREPDLIGWAAHPGGLDQFASRLRNAGIAFGGPQPGSRKRPDGRILNWKTLNLKDNAGVLPFLIEWSPDSPHPSEDAPRGAKLEEFSIAGPDPTKLESACKAMGVDVAVKRSERPQLRARISGPNGKMMELSS